MYAVVFFLCAFAVQTFASLVASPLVSSPVLAPAVVSSRSSQFIAQNFNTLAVPVVPAAPAQFAALHPAPPAVAPARDEPGSGQVEDFARLRGRTRVEVEPAKVTKLRPAEENVAPLLAAHLAAADVRNAERAQEAPAARVATAPAPPKSARLEAAPAARLAAVPAVASPYLASSAFTTSNFYRNVVLL